MSAAGRRNGAARQCRASWIVAIVLSTCPATAIAGWQTFHSRHGLPTDEVIAILEDRRERLWFLTGDGASFPQATRLSAYDGATWKTMTMADGLPDTAVTHALRDREGNLWVSTPAGLGSFDGQTWRTSRTEDGVGSDGAWAIHQSRSGWIWVANGRGIARFDGSTWRTLSRGVEMPDILVTGFAEDSTGNLWVRTWGSGAWRFDGDVWRSFTTGEGLGDDRVECLLGDRAGSMWIATSGGGVGRFDGISLRTFTTVEGLPSNQTNCLLQDRLGNIWLGTALGACRWDGAAWTAFPAGGAQPGTSKTLLEDWRGNVWFGSPGGGLFRFDGTRWTRFRAADGLAGDYVLWLSEDNAGNLWVGTRSGASRYDGSTWRRFNRDEGLAGNAVLSMLEDRRGDMWFGCYDTDASEFRGLSRFDGSGWLTITAADGLADNWVLCMEEDAAGHLWFGTGSGASRFIPEVSEWQTLTVADGLGENRVNAIREDRGGNLWFGTHGGGVSRLAPDGSWQTFTSTDSLAGEYVSSILEDHSGNLWIGFHGRGRVPDPKGVSRFDGSRWTTFTPAEGLGGLGVDWIVEDLQGLIWFGCYDRLENQVVSRFDGTSWSTFATPYGQVAMAVDRDGAFWFGGKEAAGVGRFDGSSWKTFTDVDGLSGNTLSGVLPGRTGSLWFAAYRVDYAYSGFEGAGVTRYDPDRVAPQTILLGSLPPLSTSTDFGIMISAAFGETQGIEFSYSFDGAAWTAWSSNGGVLLDNLPDGPHVLRARARDYLWNTDLTPASVTFEVDATPPAPVIAAPSFGQAVRGMVEVRGTATDVRFERYRVTVRPVGSTDRALLVESTAQVTDGLLATWDTSPLPDGDYEIRLAVEDTLGLTGSALVTVRVDNRAPFDEQTAPAQVYAATGGDIYTLNGELHLYFPPHAFGVDAQVTIDAVPADSVPETLPSGASRVLPGYEVGWRAATLEKPTRLEFSLAGVDLGALAGPLAIHFSADGTSWQRLGGTVEGERITLAVSAEGRYALFAGGATPSGSQALSRLSFTPRVFSPAGTFADRRVGIGFTLGRAGPVTVRVHNRAGWVVREVARGVSLGAGSNLVWWDGTDRDGAIVEDGLYLVTVEALGEMKRQTLAVVR